MMTDLIDNYYWLFFFAAALYGGCLGSFLNVCIYRMPRGESVINVPSHCTKCGVNIKWYDNIPVVSYIILRGRCRKCRESYSPRYMVVELSTAILFALLFWKVAYLGQPLAELWNYYTLTLLCIAASLIDMEHRIIPDLLTIPAMLLGLVYAAFFPGLWGLEHSYQGVLAALIALLGTGFTMALLTLAGQWLFRRDALGWGDVKFIMAIAALTGVGGAFFALLAGSVTGVIYGVAAATVKKENLRRTTIPFGPFLALGAMLWIFFSHLIQRILPL